MSHDTPLHFPPSPAPHEIATNVPDLVQALPSDVPSFRALCTILETLEDEVGPHLDAFSCVTVKQGSEIDRGTLVELFRRRRRELELAVLVLCPRLADAPVRSIYPGYLLAKLCDDGLGRRSSKDLTTLLSRLEHRAPMAWERAVNAFHALSDRSQNWRVWPDSEVTREAVEAMRGIATPWSDVVRSLRRELSGGRNRERRRDPAFRRAVSWHAITSSLLGPLAVPGGPMRIITDYCFGVIAYFDAAIANPAGAIKTNQAASDLLILEVFGMLEQFSLADDDIGDGTPHFLEQGETNRRKRIQRARLQVLTRWTQFVDDVTWMEWVYPALRRIPALRAGASGSEAPAMVGAQHLDDPMIDNDAPPMGH